jgi:Ca2+-binding EF-hand superfamily protein
MKKLLIGAAALGLSAPVIAQVAAPAPTQQAQQPLAAKAHTRAAVQAHVAQMFTRLDTDRDGFLTKAEAEAGQSAMGTQIRERLKQRQTERGGDAGGDVFARLDANNDGSITRAEWDAGRAQRKERVAEGARRMDGAQATARANRMEGAHGMGGGHRMAMMGGRMFDTADANRDGRVSLQEAQAGALAHFDKLDANRDGQITREERMQKRKRVPSAPSAG